MARQAARKSGIPGIVGCGQAGQNRVNGRFPLDRRRAAGTENHDLDEIIARARSADWQKKTVASMHTKQARRAAKARLQAFNKLWDQLEAELRGDDLK